MSKPDVPSHVGGSFAPPLDLDTIKAYQKLAAKASPVVKDGIDTLAKMAATFQQTPKSKAKGTPHPSGRGSIIKLEPAEVERIDAVVPWKHELDGLAGVFDTIDPAGDKALRDAAFHLLWFGYELTADRQPCTTDML